MSDSPMADALGHIVDLNASPKRFLMFPEGGPMESHVGLPKERYDCDGGHYVMSYSGANFCGYEWVPDSTTLGR